MTPIKLFDYLDNTVFDIIDVANEEGCAHFVVPKAYLPAGASLRSKATLRKTFEAALQPHYLFVQHAKNWLEKIETESHVLEDGAWLVKFNAARLFFLPGVEPGKELAELRSLFEVMKEYFVANAYGQSPAVIRAMNNRDRNGRVYGSFTCLKGAEQPTDITKELQARIEASPVLQHFQRHCALALCKVGRYSWCDLREENFFRVLERPWKLMYRKRY